MELSKEARIGYDLGLVNPYDVNLAEWITPDTRVYAVWSKFYGDSDWSMFNKAYLSPEQAKSHCHWFKYDDPVKVEEMSFSKFLKLFWNSDSDMNPFFTAARMRFLGAYVDKVGIEELAEQYHIK